MYQKLLFFWAVGVIAVAAVMFADCANATTISITNPSFESPSLADGASSTSHPGWTLSFKRRRDIESAEW